MYANPPENKQKESLTQEHTRANNNKHLQVLPAILLFKGFVEGAIVPEQAISIVSTTS